MPDLTIAEVGAILRQSRWTVARLIHKKLIKAHRASNAPKAPWRISTANLQDFMDQHTITPPPDRRNHK